MSENFGQSYSNPQDAAKVQWLAWPRKPLSKPKGGEKGAAKSANRAMGKGKSGKSKKNH